MFQKRSANTISQDPLTTEGPVGLTTVTPTLDVTQQTRGEDLMPNTRPRDSIGILGVRILAVSFATACRELVKACAGPRCMKVYLPNAATLNISCEDVLYRQVLNAGDYVLRDGIGLQIAAWLQRKRFPENLVGTDFVPMLCGELGKRGMSVYLLGGRPGIAERAAMKLTALCPGLQIAGCHDGYFDKENCDDVVAEINKTSPDLLLVAFGNPLQERWISHHAPQLNVGVAIGVGGFFDHLAGELTRAPLWMRNCGLEWLHILLGQPQKWRRYILGNPLFLKRIIAERLRSGFGYAFGRLRSVVKHFLRWLFCLMTTTRQVEDKPGRESLRILTYHDVQEAGRSSDPFCVFTSDFRRQMEVIAKGWNVVPLGEAVNALKMNQALPPRAVSITFDDGYRGVLENAVPVLLEFGLPATIFLRCDVLDSGCEAGDANAEGRYITWDEARALLASGIEIGSHTLTHRPLSRLPLEEAKREILESKRLLERELQTQIDLFSYPYGTGSECNSSLARRVEDAGYRGAVTSVNGVNTPGTGAYALRRTKVECRDSVSTFSRLLCRGMDCWWVMDKYGSILQERGSERDRVLPAKYR